MDASKYLFHVITLLRLLLLQLFYGILVGFSFLFRIALHALVLCRRIVSGL
jgi:hypothetical protein